MKNKAIKNLYESFLSEKDRNCFRIMEGVLNKKFTLKNGLTLHEIEIGYYQNFLKRELELVKKINQNAKEV